MSEDTPRHPGGKRNGGQFAPKNEGKKNPPKTRGTKTQGKDNKKPSNPSEKFVTPVRAPLRAMAPVKPKWKPIWNIALQPNDKTLGTLEYVIYQAESLTEAQAVLLSTYGGVPNLNSSQTYATNLVWGQAQEKSFALLGEERYVKLEATWISKWPDFSHYQSDDALDASWNIMANTIIALTLRGELSKKEYDTLTLPWRTIVGGIHAGDLEVSKVSKPGKQGKTLPLDFLNTSKL